MARPIMIRAHHLACILRFYHGGYDQRFADNMKKICTTFRNKPDTKVKVIVGKPDDICYKCLYLHKNKCTQSPEIGKWVVTQDKRTLKHLKLKENSIHKARDVFNLTAKKINPKTIKKVCIDCIFLDNCIKVGMNKSCVKDLNKN